MGLVGQARGFFYARLRAESKIPLAVLVPDNDTLRRRTEGVRAFDPEAAVLSFPALTGNPFRGEAPHARILQERAQALSALASGERADVLFAAAPAWLEKITPPERFSAWVQALRTGLEIVPHELLRRLEAMGYVHADRVLEPGECSMRGGIVDLFPLMSAFPLRVEFFGDRIESLRSFDPATQRSQAPSQGAVLCPSSETVLDEGAVRRFTESTLARGMNPALAQSYASEMERGGRFPGIEFHASLLYAGPARLHAHLAASEMGDRFRLIVENPPACRAAAEAAVRRFGQMAENSEGAVLKAEDVYAAEDSFGETALEIWDLAKEGGEASPESGSFFLNARPAPKFSESGDMLVEYLRERLERGSLSTVMAAASTGRGRRLAETLAEKDVAAPWQERLRWDAPPRLAVWKAPVEEGFECGDWGLAVLGEADLFGEVRLAAPKAARARQAPGDFAEALRDFGEGDYVVHADHGVGRFAALRPVPVDGHPAECLELEFADGKIFLPVERVSAVERYAPRDAVPPPRLDRMGSAQWKKIRARVERSAEALAMELLDLYARRAARRGHAFAVPAPLEEEFAAAFPYDLTADQKKAVEDVRADMAAPRPMDRLLVGDVGFGKTEVAALAAYVAAAGGRQTALLAPTTVLAVQHFYTFQERFKGFPVNIACLSSLQSRKEQESVLEELAEGRVDVVIGTHRLLQPDVSFRGLGLLILDEEQRFGVRQKERLKAMREGVDVLTMSATPIPRTLHLAMNRLRDMSFIATPPPDRLAVHTIVLPFDEEVVRTALDRERRRGGQAYYVHNDIATLPWHEAFLKRLSPDLRVTTLHGRMTPRQEEKALLDFLEHRCDVLAATSIVENGLDVPRANTLIVTAAHMFGLSDLYQLRGRVGRSDLRAYAYLFVPPDTVLTAEARERLRAIQEFSFLGAGFHLAARDLEIRGAGSLLGKEQSGHIEAVGFGMYMRLLEEKIRTLRGEERGPRVEPSLRLGVDARFPPEYIPDMAGRFRLYRRLAETWEERPLAALREETEDVHGPLPEEGRRLFALASLRVLARAAQVEQIERRGASLFFAFHPSVPPEQGRLAAFLRANPRAGREASGKIRVDVPCGEDGKLKYDVLEVARKTLLALSG
jgi:transcription-repair coupling factor (superfamily II helicase)